MVGLECVDVSVRRVTFDTVDTEVMTALPTAFSKLHELAQGTAKQVCEDDGTDPLVSMPLESLKSIAASVAAMEEKLGDEDLIYSGKKEFIAYSTASLEQLLSEVHEGSRKLAIPLAANKFEADTKMGATLALRWLPSRCRAAAWMS